MVNRTVFMGFLFSLATRSNSGSASPDGEAS